MWPAIIAAAAQTGISIADKMGAFKSKYQWAQEKQTLEDWARKNEVYGQYQDMYKTGAQNAGVRADANERMSYIDPFLKKMMSQNARSQAAQYAQRFGSGGGVSGLGSAAQTQVSNDYSMQRGASMLQSIQDALQTRFSALDGALKAAIGSVNSGGDASATEQQRYNALGGMVSGAMGSASQALGQIPGLSGGGGAGVGGTAGTPPAGIGGPGMSGGGAAMDMPAPSASPAAMQLPKYQLQMPSWNPYNFYSQFGTRR